MASPVKNVAARYLDSLPEGSPARSPLSAANRHNMGSPQKGKSLRSKNSDLDDLARQMNIETPAKKTDILRSRFETPSATISSFKTTPTARSSTSQSGSKSPAKISTLNVPIEPLSASKSRTSADSKAYEYLCRIQAIKNWLQAVLEEQIPQTPAELIAHVQNGIYLAKLANVFLPSKKQVYAQDARLEFRHTENINRFFKLLKFLEIPDVFSFELTDLYDAKDVPKVWFCLHAISYKIHALDPAYPAMENLVGKVDFEPSDIRIASRSLVGHQLPNFSSADNANVASPGTSAYMNKALSVASPSKSPISPSKVSLASKAFSQETDAENPFLEKQKPSLTPESAGSYKLGEMKMPDLSVPASKRNPNPTSSLESDHSVKASVKVLQSTSDSASSNISSNTSSNIMVTVDNSSRNTLSDSHSDSIHTQSPYYTPELDAHAVNITKLQALCKGSLLRYDMFVKKIMVKSFDTELTTFFSVLRGNMLRSKTVHRHRDKLLLYKDEFLALQSAARSKMLQRRMFNSMMGDEEGSVGLLQNVIRGSLVRKNVRQKEKLLRQEESKILELQSRIRAHPIHTRSSLILQNQTTIEDNILQLQSIARRFLYTRRQNETVVSHLKTDERLVELQALIRGALARNSVRQSLRGVHKRNSSLVELQSIARGAITRTRLCNNVLITLLGEDIKMSELFAKARGNFARDALFHKKTVLGTSETNNIILLQSKFRGILLRFRRSVDLEDIYENVGFIIGLQAKIRANFVRADHLALARHYELNIDKVVKAQTILRSKYTKDAYKTFVRMKSPPVDVVRKFAYLLSDSGADFDEETELTNLKDEILEKSKSNEDLEAQIENLDIKLSLLDKNKISIEDFMKHGNKYKTHKPAPQNGSMKKLLEHSSKSVKKRVELYSAMFYFLQTSPSYWLRLYETMNPGDPTGLLQSLHSQITPLFSLSRIAVNSRPREEYFFVKLMCALMGNDMKKNSTNIADITKTKTAFWVPFLLEFNNQTPQRAYLKKHFGRPVEKVLDDDETVFESNPSSIHALLRAREINVYGKSDLPAEIEPQNAIQNAQVSAQFVRNLTSLRDATSDVIETLKSSVASVPVHVRLVAKTAFELSQTRFPEHSEQSHLSVAGVVVIKHYVASLMQSPQNFGYSTRDPISADGMYPARCADNLKYLSRVLLQVFSMKAFSDNFMKPLNDFVLSYAEETKAVIKEIINVRELEIEYEINDYDDLVSHERPLLTMKVSDMIAMEKLVCRNSEVMVPSLDDQLYAILGELNDLVNSADDFVTLTEMNSLTLALSPASHEFSVAESKTRHLWAQAKRCLLYIMRVQDGDDLLELFVRGIRPEHEKKFREIIEDENRGTDRASKGQSTRVSPYGRSPLGDMSNMSYVNLKKLALKVILQLEGQGVVTRKDSYQELLNQVVLDIKTKASRRKSRKSQLLIAEQTVAKLMEKETFLRRQLRDYNKHIDSILLDLQRKPKDKKLFNIIPVFSKQYFYHRQLKKNNRLPKFGSYKYSAKKLMEQGVVKDIGGALHKKSASSSKVEFMFSCHKAGVFDIEAAAGTVNIPGACNTITLDKVLDQQYEHKKAWTMFDGMVTFDTEGLASLIFRHFYDIRKD